MEGERTGGRGGEGEREGGGGGGREGGRDKGGGGGGGGGGEKLLLRNTIETLMLYTRIARPHSPFTEVVLGVLF